MDEGAITDWSFPSGADPRRGPGPLRARETGGRTIEQLPLPLGVVATDLSDGAPILFRQGDTGMAVRASSAVPAVFQPVKIGTHGMWTAGSSRRCRCGMRVRWGPADHRGGHLVTA